MQIEIASIVLGVRQRKEFNEQALAELAQSLQTIGQINPIVVEQTAEGYLLIAGERRLRAAQAIGWTSIEATLKSELGEDMRQLIEFEENTKRADLTWQEHVDAALRYHELRVRMRGEDHTIAESAKELSVSQQWLAKCISVAREIPKDPMIRSAVGISAAYNIVRRKIEREVDAAAGPPPAEPPKERELEEILPPPTPAPATNATLLKASFLDWAPSYSGKPFTFLHCDFPYGVGMDANPLQHTRADLRAYPDSPELYEALLKTLCREQHRIMAPNCHVMFWLSMRYYTMTMEIVHSHGLRANPFPLVWIKSDNKGLLPDPERGPRQIYETALIITRGDPKIVRAKSNAVALPTGKSEALHLSEKPMEVLRQFLPMFVDGSSRVLDPTCGAGSALAVARELGAESVTGLDIDEGFLAASHKRIANVAVTFDLFGMIDAAAANS